MLANRLRLSLQTLAVCSFVALFWLMPSLAASSVLRQAEIYKLCNTRLKRCCADNGSCQNLSSYDIKSKRQDEAEWKRVSIHNIIKQQYSLRSGANSRADLSFNQGVLLAFLSGGTFEFSQTLNTVNLRDKARALFIFRYGSKVKKTKSLKQLETETPILTITTPEATIGAEGSTLFISNDPERKTTRVGALTNGSAKPVTVYGRRAGRVELAAGQVVTIVDGEVAGIVEEFDLQWFYRTSELAASLAPGQEKLIAQEPPDVQKTLKTARVAATEALEDQKERLREHPMTLTPFDLSQPPVYFDP